jgi:tol-pal system protein YbgF
LLLVSVGGAVVASPAPVSSLSASANQNAVARLERLLQARNHMQVEMQDQLTELSGELDMLRGIVEKNSHQLDKLLERQRDIYKELDAIKKDISAGVTTKVSTDNKTKTIEYSSDQSENSVYDAAVDLILKDKNYKGAISAFNAFIEKYPHSLYQPNAHYWLGQLYFSMNNLEAAQKHFVSVSQFEQSTKRADALLKLGLIAEKKGDKAGAKDKFDQVISLFPDTTSANQAKQGIGRL